MSNYPDRFERAIEKLSEAFFEGELESQSPCRCAVGTLCNNKDHWVSVVHNGSDLRIGTEVVKATGYSPQELGRIEDAFERAGVSCLHPNYNTMEDQYNRLMATVDVLMEIDGIDEDESIRDQFHKEPA